MFYSLSGLLPIPLGLHPCDLFMEISFQFKVLPAQDKRLPISRIITRHKVVKTQIEQTELKTKVSEGRKRLSDEVQLANDAKQWVEAIQEYANITELDAATLNRLIKEIVVHERIDEDKTRHISIEIHFNLKPIPEVEQVTA